MNHEEDIAIAEVFRNFTALYDKQCKDYHRRDVQKNCWTSVVLESGLESGKYFFNISLPKKKKIIEENLI